MSTYTVIPGGDALKPEAEGMKLIPHVCNDIGGWGAGFVMAVSRKWSKPEQKYREWYRDGKFGNNIPFALGEIQAVKVERDIAIVNMIGQHQTGHGEDGRPPIRYGALARAMERVAALATKHKASIHCPKFGSALAGGDWHVIQLMIHELWVDKGIPVTVYDIDARP